MNRALKLLLQDKRVDADATGNSTFTKWKRSGRDKEIENAFNDLVVGDAFWGALIATILFHFESKKVVPKKTLSAPVSLETSSSYSGNVVDRTALLACALADPELLPSWVDISKPIMLALVCNELIPLILIHLFPCTHYNSSPLQCAICVLKVFLISVLYPL